MSRTIFIIADVFSAPNLLLVDSAVKGTALLVLAAVAAVIFRHASAARRHLMWLLAIAAMLVVPVLSAMLPQWRALPQWAGIPPKPVAVHISSPLIARPADGAVALPQIAGPVEIQRPSATAHQPAAAPPDARPPSVTPQAIPAPAVRNWNWLNALPFAWAIGFCVLVLRLMAARWMLWNAERQGSVIRSRRQPGEPTDDPIVTALDAASLQFGIGRPVTLLIHPDKTIPVVWGILRCRLLLPVAARNWSGEQLRSVLLHELAHIKRRDTMAQLLRQIACALHWFNPLVWIAAWRLDVESERACDDLVLASGVRPSVYAAHLLDVVTALAPARWQPSCGLAMARQSSLEGRLVAVLSKTRNRRGVSVVLAAIALTLAVGIAVPIAMLRAADEKPAAPAPQEPPKPPAATKPSPGAEEKLQWGEPVNGLRAAIAIRPAPGGPKEGGTPDIYLVVQNVSKAPIHLNDTTAAPDLRGLYLKLDGVIESEIVDKEPTQADVMLQPGEAAFLLMFTPDPKNPVARTTGSILAEDALKDTHQTLVAQMQLEHAPAGAWTGKLVTGETSGEAAADMPRPKDKQAQSLFQQWLANARTDGKIPGALVGKLGEKVKYFISLNKKDTPANGDLAVKFEKLLPRFDATHDWTQSDAIALLDDVSTINTIPLLTTLESARENVIRAGEPLPDDLADAPWGQPSPDGLRVAWLLEPQAKEYPLGTSLKRRILVHNSGKKAVIFTMPSWQQPGIRSAHDANGEAIKVTSTEWLTEAGKMTIRLAPGEYCETPAPGIGVGTKAADEDWADVRVGDWLDVKPGDEVRLTPGAVDVSCSPSVIGTEMMDGHPLNVAPKDAADLWGKIIAERVERELPLPAAAAEREQIIRRVTLDLFGESPTAEEIAAFIADNAATAPAKLEKRLADRPGIAPFTGTLPPGDIQFRVLAPDPDAAKKPRVATGPGFFILGDNRRLQVERTSNGNGGTNKATILFFSTPAKPYEIALPDGRLTYAIAWERGAGVVWIKQKGMVRGYDFTNPEQVKETIFREPADLEKVPKPILDALPAVLDEPSPPPPAMEAP